VRRPEPKGLEAIARLVRPLLTPLATSALVVLFLLFISLQREDLRDRFLRLAGTADLQRTTAALDDAASRLSRFFLAQTLLNTAFGLFIAGGLWVIGVPNAVLWGILAGLMRFVPFIGGFIAAFFPIALAAAVDPGWSMALATAALFLIAEPLAGHIIEPLLYGQHTGLSPVAIVIASLFWTLLWGPVGLLLATPLTVCLVVLGKHIDALEFVAVALGDEPALKPEEQFYQRLLAGNVTARVAPGVARAASRRLYWNAQPSRPGCGYHARPASHEPRPSMSCGAVLRRAVRPGQRRGPRCSARVPFVFRGGHATRSRAHYCAPGEAIDATRTSRRLLLDAGRRSRQAGSMAQGRRS